MEIVTIDYLESKGFQSNRDTFGWEKIRKDGFELVNIPMQSGSKIIGFEYQFSYQAKYKYPLTISELSQLYKILTGKDL
jgi:hypothetical protein